MTRPISCMVMLTWARFLDHTGPWKVRPGVVLEPAPLTAWDSFVTNPSLYFFPNGTALLAYRCGGGRRSRSLPWMLAAALAVHYQCAY